MPVEWTASQKQRLKELGIPAEADRIFNDTKEREEVFKDITSEHLSKVRKDIKHMLDYPNRPE